MPVIPAPPGPTHELDGTSFTSLATPSRGSAETAVWQVEIAPGTPSRPHSLTREEVFVVLAGAAQVTIDGEAASAAAGASIVVPPGARFEVANASDEVLRMVCCLPVGGQARLDGGVPFTPPWAE